MLLSFFAPSSTTVVVDVVQKTLEERFSLCEDFYPKEPITQGLILDSKFRVSPEVIILYPQPFERYFKCSQPPLVSLNEKNKQNKLCTLSKQICFDVFEVWLLFNKERESCCVDTPLKSSRQFSLGC